jgi:acetoin utilization protein AcuB
MSTHEASVAQFMTQTPVTADQDLLLSDAQQRMAIDNIRHLIVLDAEKHVVGVLSSGDVALALSLPDGDRKRLKIRDAMSDNPFVCPTSTPLSQVALAMEAHRWGCAIVLEGHDVVGIFTTTDALRALRELSSGVHADAAVHPTHLPPLGGGPAVPRLRVRSPRPIDTSAGSVFRPGG